MHIKNKVYYIITLYKVQGQWSSGMIPALGAGGPGFDSLLTPKIIKLIKNNLLEKKKSN